MKSTMAVGGRIYASVVPWSLEDCAEFCGRLVLLPFLALGLVLWAAVAAAVALVQGVDYLARGAVCLIRVVSRSSGRQVASSQARSASSTRFGC